MFSKKMYFSILQTMARAKINFFVFRQFWFLKNMIFHHLKIPKKSCFFKVQNAEKHEKIFFPENHLHNAKTHLRSKYERQNLICWVSSAIFHFLAFLAQIPFENYGFSHFFFISAQVVQDLKKQKSH